MPNEYQGLITFMYVRWITDETFFWIKKTNLRRLARLGAAAAGFDDDGRGGDRLVKRRKLSQQMRALLGGPEKKINQDSVV